MDFFFLLQGKLLPSFLQTIFITILVILNSLCVQINALFKILFVLPLKTLKVWVVMFLLATNMFY